MGAQTAFNNNVKMEFKGFEEGTTIYVVVLNNNHPDYMRKLSPHYLSIHRVCASDANKTETKMSPSNHTYTFEHESFTARTDFNSPEAFMKSKDIAHPAIGFLTPAALQSYLQEQLKFLSDDFRFRYQDLKKMISKAGEMGPPAASASAPTPDAD